MGLLGAVRIFIRSVELHFGFVRKVVDDDSIHCHSAGKQADYVRITATSTKGDCYPSWSSGLVALIP